MPSALLVSTLYIYPYNRRSNSLRRRGDGVGVGIHCLRILLVYTHYRYRTFLWNPLRAVVRGYNSIRLIPILSHYLTAVSKELFHFDTHSGVIQAGPLRAFIIVEVSSWKVKGFSIKPACGAILSASAISEAGAAVQKISGRVFVWGCSNK